MILDDDLTRVSIIKNSQSSSQKYLPELTHLAQYDFIACRNILHNAQIIMDYAQHTHYKGIMVLLDLVKVYYDRPSCQFIVWFMCNAYYGL